MAISNETAIPKMRVQRMGAKWRIVYDESRSLARYGSPDPNKPGEPVDGGGFEDVWEGQTKTVDGQLEAMKKLSLVISGQQTSDPEEETVGP